MNSVIKSIAACVLLVAGVSVQADQASDQKNIRQALSGLQPDSIEATPVPGLYEVVVGPSVVYMSADGRYMLQGDLIDVQKRENLTDVRRRDARRAALDSVGEGQMIIFAPKQVKHVVTVFTDIDCAYCRKLHREIDNYLDAGIEIRYMLYPRAGVDSDSYRKAVAVWCADDRKKALTDAKAGKSIPMKRCDNPVKQQMDLAQQLGLRGTPYLVLENGDVAPGYVPAKQLAQMLDGKTPTK